MAMHSTSALSADLERLRQAQGRRSKDMVTVPVGHTPSAKVPCAFDSSATQLTAGLLACAARHATLGEKKSALGSLFFLRPAASTPRGRGQAAPMDESDQDGQLAAPERQQTSMMLDVSNALVALHKEQFGRGPTKARSNFAGPDALVCVMDDVLLPAERKLVALGQQASVRETRSAFQVATATEFITTVEQIVYRKVRAFASAIDPDANTVFETFHFEPLGSDDTP